MNATARLSNVLVRSELEVLTLTEHRILLNALRCIHTHNTELPPFGFKMKDVLDRVNGKARELLHDAVRRLRRRLFDGNSLFHTLEADDATLTISGTFNPAQAHHLLYHKMKDAGFTQVDLSSTQFTSIHAYRLFWLLSSYRPGKQLHLDLDRFRGLVLGDRTKYAVWQNLKKHVLRLVSEQFVEAGYPTLDYAERQRGKSIVSLTITVPNLTRAAVWVAPAPRTLVAPAPENAFVVAVRQQPAYFELYTRLIDVFKIEPNTAEHILHWVNQVGFRERLYLMNRTLQKVSEHVAQSAKNEKGAVSNLGAYTLVALKNAKANFEAKLAEQQEQQENRRSAQAPSAAPAVNTLLGRLAGKLSA